MIIRKQYLNQIRPFYDSEMIKIIAGVRRCGKSTLLHQIIDEIKSSGINEDHIIYINFENYKYHSITNADAFYEYINDFIIDKDKYYLFFDEIQNVVDFELVINSFRATENTSIFITGSNSKLLSSELHTHLSGRTLSFRLLPFNFREFCEYKSSSNYKLSNKELFKEYMKWGGFPLVLQNDSDEAKEVIISNIYDSIVLRDIVSRNNISSTTALERVLDYIITNTSTTVSGNNIAQVLNDDYLSISAPTVYDYLKYIEDACICDKVSRYDIRGKKVLSKEEKMYVCDLGLFKLKKNRIKDEYNYIIETIVYNELISRGYNVYIGKLQKVEIDFIATKGSEKIYIQVAYLLNNDKTIEREFSAYNYVDDNYPKYVLSLDDYLIERDGIIHQNVIDFLLNK